MRRAADTGDVGYGSVVVLLELLLAVAVYLDARRLGIRGGGPTGMDGHTLGALGWGLLTLCGALAVVVYLAGPRRRAVRARGVTVTD